MSLPHFFLADQVIAEEAEAAFPLELDRDDAKHARVLRLSAGEHVAVVDGAGYYFECEIVSFDETLPLVKVAQRLDAPRAFPEVCLVQGLAKGDKMETVIRHATELGVCRFIPFAAARSIMKVDARKVETKVARWQAIAKSAAMQSGQTRLPVVDAPASLKQLVQALGDFDAVLICWEEAPGTCLISEALACVKARGEERAAEGDAASGEGAATRPESAPTSSAGIPRVAVVVGPEGGLTAQEVDALLAANDHASLVTLGSSILRTETAGVVGPALVLYELGQLGGKVRP